jgi:polysaccharide export outer membrane protein
MIDFKRIRMKKLLILIILTIFFLNCQKKPDLYQFQKNSAQDNSGKKIEVPKISKEKLKEQLNALHNIKKSRYKIGSGDIFDIFVYDEPDLNTEKVVVKTDGTISIKLIGEVKILESTLTEAKKILEENFKKFLKYPQISIIPYKLSSSHFTIIGKIKNPGSYPMESKTKVLDALALSGGFTTGIFDDNTVEMADLEHAFISRKGTLLPVNFVELVRKGNMLHNVPLIDGDYIYIPSSMNKEVFIIGEVKVPSFYGYSENLTLMQLIARAGGFINSASSQAIIIRGSLRNPIVYSINTSKILRGQIRDIKIHPEDIVYIPKSFIGKWNKIISMILPSIETIQTGLLIQNLTK